MTPSRLVQNRRRGRRVIVAVTLLIASAASVAFVRFSLVPPHAEAAGEIIRILDSVPIVAIGDIHALEQQGTFYEHLMRHPKFPAARADVVMELGNELYQNVADRYVAGHPVPMDSLRMIWEDNTQSPLQTSSAPMYADILHTARAVNAELPSARRFRVLLGDPAIEWRTVTRDQLWELHKRRGDRLREIVRDSVLPRGRRAVILAGFMHIRRVPHEGGRDEKWGDLADRVFVVGVHNGFGGRTARFQPMLDSVPAGSLLRVRGTFLETLAVNDVDMPVPAPGMPVKDTIVPSPRAGMVATSAGLTLADRMDGYLYLGNITTYRASIADVSRIRNDATRLDELHRRSCMIFGQPVDTTRFFATRNPVYYPTGSRRSMVEFDPIAPLPDAPPPLPPTLPEPCASLLARGR